MESSVAAQVVTPEELRQIVTAAVTHAIAAYEKVRASKAAPVRNPPIPRFTPNVTRDSAPPSVPPSARLARLQEEMGLLEEIEFEETGPKPELADLSADMGIDGFAFDAPRRPDLYPHAPSDQTVAAALADWDEALKRLSSGPKTADDPPEGLGRAPNCSLGTRTNYQPTRRPVVHEVPE